MKCPKCGFEIPEGCLLCENCGEEIQIVPDLEMEVEDSIHETMSTVAEDLNAGNQNLEEISENSSEIEHQNRKLLRISTVLILAMIITIISYIFISYFRSPQYRIHQAEGYQKQGDYEKAIEALQSAVDRGGDYATVYFIMAEYYSEQGDQDEFLNTLLAITDQDGVTNDDAILAYQKIIEYYLSLDEYEAINSLLQNCQYESLQEEYTLYMADAPDFNYVEGSYNEIIPLKIIANTRGHIYYTLDGSVPNSHSDEYISPVFLDSGDYIVTAYFVNEYGVKSPLSKSEYHVDVSTPFSPEVNAYSGEYYTPQMIQVDAEEGCSIYYTTDGSVPTIDSILYNGFLPMPLGKSEMKFVAIDENQIASEVTTRNYDLELMTNYTTDDAQTVILDYLVSQGMIINKTGVLTSDQTRKMYYSFACCVSIADQGDFYVFSEYILNSDNTKEKTGNYYAVGIYNLPLYKTQYSAESGNFALSGEQLNPDYVQNESDNN